MSNSTPLRCFAAVLGPFALACATETRLLSDPVLEAKLSDLSRLEREDLCAELDRGPLEERMLAAYCLALTAEDAATCEAGFEACMDALYEERCVAFGFESCWNPVFVPPPGEADPAYCVPAHLGTCAATVDEWTGCLDEATAAIEAFADLTCADLVDDPDPAARAAVALRPASCHALLERCPGLEPILTPYGATPDGLVHGHLSEDDAVVLEFRTEGRVVSDLSSWGGMGAGRGLGGPLGDRVQHDFTMPVGAPFGSASVFTAMYPAGESHEGEAVGLMLSLPYPKQSTWSTRDGCTADVEVLTCDDDPSFTETRYRIRNGRCQLPLMLRFGEASDDVRVVSFEGSSACGRLTPP